MWTSSVTAVISELLNAQDGDLGPPAPASARSLGASSPKASGRASVDSGAARLLPANRSVSTEVLPTSAAGGGAWAPAGLPPRGPGRPGHRRGRSDGAGTFRPEEGGLELDPLGASPPPLQRSGAEGHPSVVSSPLEELSPLPGNHRCADCGNRGPDWASIGLGVLLCLRCSGLHRQLGTHVSKVRSLTLDVRAWTPAVVARFRALGGNERANAVWEGAAAAQGLQQRPGAAAGDAERAAFIQAKCALTLPTSSAPICPGSLSLLSSCARLVWQQSISYPLLPAAHRYVRREFLRDDLAALARGPPDELSRLLHQAVLDRSPRVRGRVRERRRLHAVCCQGSSLGSRRAARALPRAEGCGVPRGRGGSVRRGGLPVRGRRRLLPGESSPAHLSSAPPHYPRPSADQPAPRDLFFPARPTADGAPRRRLPGGRHRGQRPPARGRRGRRQGAIPLQKWDFPRRAPQLWQPPPALTSDAGPAQDSDGATALHRAAAAAEREAGSGRPRSSHGGSLFPAAAAGDSACFLGPSTCVTQLLQFEAAATARDAGGRTPVELCPTAPVGEVLRLKYESQLERAGGGAAAEAPWRPARGGRRSLGAEPQCGRNWAEGDGAQAAPLVVSDDVRASHADMMRIRKIRTASRQLSKKTGIIGGAPAGAYVAAVLASSARRLVGN